MNRSTFTALTVAGLLSLGSLSALAQSNGAPVNKGGTPPSTEMNAGNADGNALPPGSIPNGNAGDAAKSGSTSPGTGSSSTSGGSSAGSSSGSSSSGTGSAGEEDSSK